LQNFKKRAISTPHHPSRRSPSALAGMNTPAAATTRRTQGLTAGDFFASIGAFIKNLRFCLRISFYLKPPLKNHKKLWANLIRPQLSVDKQRSAKNQAQ
jgi:hypothetical protein